MRTNAGEFARSLEEGRALFNAGRFFEAHEAWERLWLAAQGESKLLLQGLIQIAAGLHKARGGAAGACARLLDAGLGRLAAAGVPSELQDFAASVRTCAGEARRWQRGEAQGLTAFPALPPLGGVK